MKVGLCISSDFAIERLKGELNYELIQYSDITALQEALQYYKPDIVVLDRAYPDYEAVEVLLTRFYIQIINFGGDFEDVIEQVKGQEIFFESEDEEDEAKYIPDHQKFIEALKKEAPKEKGPEIIYQEKIIEKEVEKILYTSVPSKVIVIGSLFPSSGSTLLANTLALMIAKRELDVTYIEHPLVPIPYMYDLLQIYTKEVEYEDFARSIAKSSIAKKKHSLWDSKGVKWSVVDNNEQQLPSFSYQNLLLLSHSIQSSYLIFDISNLWLNEDVQKFLYKADHIFICTESDIIKNQHAVNSLLNSYESRVLEFLSDDELNVEIIMTKAHESIDKSLFKGLFFKEPLTKVPYIPYYDIQKAINSTKFIYEDKKYFNTLEEALYPVIKKIVPKEFVRIKEDKQSSLFTKLKQKVKKVGGN